MTTHEELKIEVMTLAEEVGVKPNAIHIRAMKRKWASCSSIGRLTFNETLLDEPKEVQYKVILHELLHLKYPNHGKMFNILLKSYLEKISPDKN